MADAWDLVVVGAGPAGLAAATEAAALGLKAVVVDEQPAPGGQIYRAVERAASGPAAAALGPDYAHGRSVVAAFRASGAAYRPGLQVWQVEQSGEVLASDGQRSVSFPARRALIAIGATERPVPIPGWTLPGVMTVGAGQILLKASGMVPDGETWVAGAGPLPLLYLAQVIAAGGRIAGYVDTTAAGNAMAAAPHLLGALRNLPYVRKGLKLRGELRRSGIPVHPADAVEAVGEGRVERIRFRSGGTWVERLCDTLLLHEGVVPNVHVTMAIGCAHEWDDRQGCFRPRLDEWGRSDIPAVLVAGDCGGIEGARAAEVRGRLVALGAAADLGRLTAAERDRRARPLRRELDRHLPIRAFLDALYRPRPAVTCPADPVIACRCESVTAGQVRETVRIGAVGPNQAKSFIRCGMGPCQGRFCGLTVTGIIADATGKPPGEVGFFRIRPPLKPLTLGELAALGEDPAA
ncbi:NAD(P)/FAD-dependent oxidoreductase [Stella sp.]|uniref:FAD/NAD(P)-dependent oxidoreductase n=1 Tax=Stella sp. TaxID=2912054 RepID=UPI0035ADB125